MHWIYVRRVVPFVVLALLCCACGMPGGVSSTGVSDPQPYLERRAAHTTQLIKRGPSPQTYENEPLPPGVQEVNVPSPVGNLKAWLWRPVNKGAGPFPALVYLHGGFAFGSEDLFTCQPFMDKGYVVLALMLRGENGNPGDFEMMYGEVEDAVAAGKAVAAQDFVDPNRVYAFGHSVGAGIAGVLSLMESNYKHVGGSGGLYGPSAFYGWASEVPFDMTNPTELKLRVLPGNIASMKKHYYAYLGQQDNFQSEQALAKREAAAAGHDRLVIQELPGDHFTSLDAAVRAYLQVCERDKK